MSGESIADRVSIVRERIEAACARAGRSPDSVTVIAVTKGFQVEAICEAIAAGIADIGENRVQEAALKRAALTTQSGITWHMIGHLQTNKVKDALRLFDTIHSVDSIHLAEAISKRASTTVPVFLETNVAGEVSKGGFPLEQLPQTLETIRQMPNLDIRGLMTVAPLAVAPESVRPIFSRLRAEGDQLGLRDLSMGMTGDFEVAIEEGATHVRIGRAIFGERRI